MTKRILIIDDEEIFLDLLKTFLEERGYEVTVSTSGQKILKLLFEKHYDLVLSDVWMVDSSGLEVFKTIRKANPKLPVVLMTGYTSSALLSTIEELHVDAFVKKPFKLTEVAAVVKRLTEPPAAAAPDAESPVRPTRPDVPVLEPSRFQILVADDDDQYRATLREMFESQGLATLVAADGLEAWQLFEANPGINVLVLDIKMPRMDGLELFERVRRERPDAHVIFVTAVDDPQLHKRLVDEGGAAAVFQKPFSYRHFLRFIEMAEQLRHARQPS